MVPLVESSTSELTRAIEAPFKAPGGLLAMKDMADQSHNCSHPVRLLGRKSLLDTSTGEVSSEEAGVFYKGCGNRRKTSCVACSDIYKHDARHLVTAGLLGGKGGPESVAGHPMVFATYTAPSFGTVHRRPKSGKGPCHPAPSRCCPHGKPVACFERHGAGDPIVGQPICPDCYRYQDHVLFHAHMSELWRRTVIYTFRSLAKVLGTTPKELKGTVRLSYFKVVEYQARGAAHLHVVIRADGIAGDSSTDVVMPPPEVTTAAITEAITMAARKVSVAIP
jgi:hypothetical protein